MSMSFLDVCLSAVAFCSTITLFLRSGGSRHATSNTSFQAYILENQVTHARLSPAASKHAFTYPTLSLLVSLHALESHGLDLGRGWIFDYGGLWGRLLAIRPEPYLTTGSGSIMSKLNDILRQRHYLDDGSDLDDAWMMTMPSILGFEGINPLTVYFCYKADMFWLTVLEIHNTFGETHVHVLEVNRNEDPKPHSGYDHQWTFHREFHVSPFNDRSGFYTVSVKNPSHPPTGIVSEVWPSPRPSVSVHLYTASTANPPAPDKLKLTALLRPTSATPLTTLAVLHALARAPFALVLTLPRILYIAWILHYYKRLDVFLRPEPLPARKESGFDNNFLRSGGGIKWLAEGTLQSFARRRVEKFLARRVDETGIAVTLVSGDPSEAEISFKPSGLDGSCPTLKIAYLTPRFFSILFACPSSVHALLLGSDSEKLFFPSSRDLFRTVFHVDIPTGTKHTFLQRLRAQTVHPALHLPIPQRHPLDTSSVFELLFSMIVLWMHIFLDALEAWIFRMTRARVVKGQEPWLEWERAVIFQARGDSARRTLPDSARREI